jgi:hypothetical protein
MPATVTRSARQLAARSAICDPEPVSDTLDDRTGGQPELGTLLALIHRADAPFGTVQATYRIWRHDERAAAAWRARIEEEKRRGASISTFGSSGDTPAPVEHEETLRVWRAGDRAREERQGGSRDGSYGVRAADLWWSWDHGNGASSNQDDPSVGSGVGEELAVMLDPTPLLSALKFVATGRSEVAHRATITADVTPRPSDPRRRPRSFELHELGSGADRYRLQVDAERGVLLEVVALRDGEPFHTRPSSNWPDFLACWRGRSASRSPKPNSTRRSPS